MTTVPLFASGKRKFYIVKPEAFVDRTLDLLTDNHRFERVLVEISRTRSMIIYFADNVIVKEIIFK